MHSMRPPQQIFNIILISCGLVLLFFLWLPVLNKFASIEQISKSDFQRIDIVQLASKQIEVPGKTIWLLWYQGWKDAPYAVRAVAKSWKFHNPTWNVVHLSKHNIRSYLHVEYLDDGHVSVQAKSDIIRLHLLAKYGGVWADSTMLCFTSLDTWIYKALEPQGLWAYSYGDEHNGKGIGVWLMIAVKHTLLLETWRDLCDEYWSPAHFNATTHSYFWMAGLFGRMMTEHAAVKAQWLDVPYLDCNAPYGANLLRNRSAHEQPVDAEFINALRSKPPFAMKLSTRRIPAEADSILTSWSMHRLRAYHAIQLALRFHRVLQHEMQYNAAVNDAFLARKRITVDGCNIANSTSTLTSLRQTAGTKVLLIDTCNFCSALNEKPWSVADEVVCRPGTQG